MIDQDRISWVEEGLRQGWATYAKRWLDACRSHCEEKWPDTINPELWTYWPTGHKLSIRAVPPQERWGDLFIPDQYQEANNVGWVLVPGPEISVPDPTRQPWVWPWHPLELVGHLVAFGKFAMTDLGFHGKDRRHRDIPDYCIMNVGDLLGVIFEDPSQPSTITPERRITL